MMQGKRSEDLMHVTLHLHALDLPINSHFRLE